VIKHSNHSREQETQTQQALVGAVSSSQEAALWHSRVGCVIKHNNHTAGSKKRKRSRLLLSSLNRAAPLAAQQQRLLLLSSKRPRAAIGLGNRGPGSGPIGGTAAEALVEQSQSQEAALMAR
jgi:hypothetical protein